MTQSKPRDYRTTLTRRRLLGGLGAFTAALTSPVWRPATAFGADNAPGKTAKRFIGLFSANGTIPAAFFPQGAAAANGATLTLGRILAPLEKYKAQMLVLKGVDMTSTVSNVPGVIAAHTDKPGGPHMKGPGGMLTGGSLMAGSFTGSEGPAGYADRQSVDQFIADKIGTTSTFKSLEFGVIIDGQEPLRVISYKGANQPNTAVDDPWAMYTRIFANANLSAGQLSQLLADRKSVLDFVKDDITRLKLRVNSDDKARLDAHLGGISSIEQQLSSSAVSCTPMTMPAKMDRKDPNYFPTTAKLQADLMLLAQTCGLTHVSTYMFGNSDSWQHYPWIGVPDEHHATSHLTDPASIEKLTQINVWHSQQIAYMLDKLAAVPDVGGGTMLDSSILLWGNELGVGNTHSYTDIPWVLMGGAGGYFKMGRFLQYKSQPHNNLLVSICNAMGLADVNTFGIPALCTGPLAGLAA